MTFFHSENGRHSSDSPWANHFRITGDRVSPEGFTYDLEWSPDAINPPIRQTVTFHPPSLIEYVLSIYFEDILIYTW